MSRLTLTSNISSLNAQRNFGVASKNLSESFARLSSGLRINKASDDAAGLAVSSLLNVDRRVANQGIRNLNDGVSYLSVAESTLNELSNIVTRISELAEQGANGTVGDKQRTALQSEVNSLQSEYNRLINTTSFNGSTILTGITSSTLLQGGYGAAGQLGVQTGEASLGLVDDPGRAGSITRVDTSSSGTAGTGASFAAAISADGRYVTLRSAATNLVAGDSNGLVDIFVKDTLTGEMILASSSSSGVISNGGNVAGGTSADGRFVAFMSLATNLVASDTNGGYDVFLKDIVTGVTTMMSTDSNGIQGNNGVGSCDISADGRYVVFDSISGNLVAGDTNGVADVFVKDMVTGVTTRVSTDSNGVQGNAAPTEIKMSADGRYVTFTSSATNLVSGDTNGVDDVFMKDLQTGVTTRISTSASGSQVNGSSAAMSISADGRYVTFNSNATNVVGGDTNAALDTFVKDTVTGSVTRVGMRNDGSEFPGATYFATISADGRYAAFSDASNATYVRDMAKAGVQEIAGMVVSNRASARTTLDLTKKYQVELSKIKAGIGASLSRANSFINNLQVQSENYSAASSQITDVDVAEESSRLVANQLIQQAAARIISQANLQPRLALKLLEDI